MFGARPFQVKLTLNGESIFCTKCKKKIKTNTMRLAEMVQCTVKDAMIPNWYDIDCFFSVVQPLTTSLLDGFAKMCETDKATITQRMNQMHAKQTRKRRNEDSASSAKKRKIGTFDNDLNHWNAPLFDMEFVVVCRLSKRMEIRDVVQGMGGKVVVSVSSKTAAIISSKNEMKFGGYQMAQAKHLGIQVVPMEFLEAARSSDPFEVINRMNMSNWTCTHPADRIQRSGAFLPKFDRSYNESVPKIQIWRNGMVFDPECELKNVHVYCTDYVKYVAVMTLVDIVQNKNSYYRIQLLESDDKKRYWLFSKHGRIATNVGNPALIKYECLRDALAAFNKLFYELTGNEFDPIKFVRIHNKYRLVDIKCDKSNEVLEHLVKSEKLEPPVCKLMKLIDNGKIQNDTMKFELDIDLVPLGKLSVNQIRSAERILRKLSKLVETHGTAVEFIEASNRFYSMVPHAFAFNRPVVINTAGMIANKSQMIERIKKVDFTYSLWTESDDQKNPLDVLYDKLNCDIEVLDENSTEYPEILKYVKNTQHADDEYSNLKVEEVFRVSRHGETERFKRHEGNFNRQLLWHGSHIRHFTSILTNGLLIEPPGVTVSAYFFGRGIYFADSVSNSAGYCRSEDGIHLLLLCEVALGICDFQFAPHPTYNLQKAAHCMSVKAVGQYYPHPFEIRPDGLKIPNGRLKLSKHNTDVDLNEFVVMDPSQVKIRYLVKVKEVYYDDEEDDEEEE